MREVSSSVAPEALLQAFFMVGAVTCSMTRLSTPIGQFPRLWVLGVMGRRLLIWPECKVGWPQCCSWVYTL